MKTIGSVTTMSAAALFTMAGAGLILPAFANDVHNHTGWICRATDGDKQQHVNYSSGTGQNSWIENESSSLRFAVGCQLPVIDGIERMNWFRVRVEDGSNDASDPGGRVKCWVFRSEIASNGAVSTVNYDSAQTGTTYTGTTTLEMELNDSSYTNWPDYIYSSKCFLPADDVTESKIFMWQANSVAQDTCPTGWNC